LSTAHAAHCCAIRTATCFASKLCSDARSHELGFDDALRLLDRTLEEEKKTDAALTKIADAMVNQHAKAA
jgi:ferritin-like metal-binding protein YciE